MDLGSHVKNEKIYKCSVNFEVLFAVEVDSTSIFLNKKAREKKLKLSQNNF